MISIHKRNIVLYYLTPICGIILLSGCGKKADPPSDSADPASIPVDVVNARVQSMKVTVNAQGTIVPAQGDSCTIAPVISGRLVAVLVKEGDNVSKGQVVAYLNSGTQSAAAQSAHAALSVAEAQASQASIAAKASAVDQSNSVKQARIALNAAIVNRKNSIAQAQTALAVAQTNLRKLKAGARPQEIAQAQQEVEKDQATLSRAETELNRVQFLFQKGIAAQRQVDDSQTSVQVAKSTLKSAMDQLNLLKAGARSEDIQTAELQVQQAQEALSQAQTGGDAAVQQAQATLNQANQSLLQVEAKQQEAHAMQVTVSQKEADYTAALANEGYTLLRSPIDGVVVKRMLNPGDMTDPNTPVLQITNVKTLNLQASLPAENGSNVKVGMQAFVFPSGGANARIDGRVIYVGQVDPLSNLLTVRIEFPNPGQKIKVGEFASTEIQLNVISHAITVPQQAIIVRDGRDSLFTVSSDNVAHLVEVATGAQRNGTVQITKGLKGCENVILLGQYELADGAKVTKRFDAMAPSQRSVNNGNQ